ncbi:MAG TPA: hypothetical protein VHI54_00085, partial [Actinomycetota bacterium]|nr:hypothetical protein [Actinomycetota bacterium]
WDELMRRFESKAKSENLVQTHGRYHSGHVFVAPGSVTVVDPDRPPVSEAARDVGEFLHRLRWDVASLQLGEPVMNQVSEVFLVQYVRHSDQDPSSLIYQWSYGILSMLLRSVCRSSPTRRQGEKRLRHLRRESDRAPRLLSAWPDDARGHN